MSSIIGFETSILIRIFGSWIVLTEKVGVKSLGLGGGINDERLNVFLRGRHARIPERLGLRVVDKNGIAAHAANTIPSQPTDISQTPRFGHWRDSEYRVIRFCRQFSGGAGDV